MAAQGRGSAAVSVLVVAACVALLLQLTPGAAATKYVVGDGAGWSRNLTWWVAGKTFYLGDVLVFDYDKARHDVTFVNRTEYRHCAMPERPRVLRTGHDEVKLRRGHNLFICGMPNHCANGMKIDVNVPRAY